MGVDMGAVQSDYEYWILGENGWKIAFGLTVVANVLSFWLIYKVCGGVVRCMCFECVVKRNVWSTKL